MFSQSNKKINVWRTCGKILRNRLICTSQICSFVAIFCSLTVYASFLLKNNQKRKKNDHKQNALLDKRVIPPHTRSMTLKIIISSEQCIFEFFACIVATTTTTKLNYQKMKWISCLFVSAPITDEIKVSNLLLSSK